MRMALKINVLQIVKHEASGKFQSPSPRKIWRISARFTRRERVPLDLPGLKLSLRLRFGRQDTLSLFSRLTVFISHLFRTSSEDFIGMECMSCQECTSASRNRIVIESQFWEVGSLLHFIFLFFPQIPCNHTYLVLRRRGASRADHVYRFNKAASLGLLGPLSPLGQFAISVVTNRYPLNNLKALKSSLQWRY